MLGTTGRLAHHIPFIPWLRDCKSHGRAKLPRQFPHAPGADSPKRLSRKWGSCKEETRSRRRDVAVAKEHRPSTAIDSDVCSRGHAEYSGPGEVKKLNSLCMFLGVPPQCRNVQGRTTQWTHGPTGQVHRSSSLCEICQTVNPTAKSQLSPTSVTPRWRRGAGCVQATTSRTYSAKAVTGYWMLLVTAVDCRKVAASP